MAVDAYFYLKGGTNGVKVEGETKDDLMSKEKAMEVLSYSFSAANPINVGSATGGLTAGKADFSGLSIMHQLDTASADLFKSLAQGEHFSDGTLLVRRSGGKTPNRYMQVNFKKLFVSSINFSGSQGEEVLVQSTSFEWGAIQFHYYALDAAGKEVSAPKEMLWSRVTNKSAFAV
ncbi:Hcp family type VI secretion system effector [Tropicimonas sp. S265A]|uniref:Hcp family type VI secretion system effector n=1 Tax=Tropicimonas sp. S265A TaxID=3415134 RepID=UPI003C7A14BE